MSSTYRILKLKADSYYDFPDGYSEISVEHLVLPQDLAELQLFPEFTTVEVPTVVTDLTKDFCRIYPQIKFPVLVSLIGGSQRLFLNFRNNIDLSSTMLRHFENEKKELAQFIDLLKKFHFGERNFINKIHFKNNGNSLMLNNFFVVSDVYRAIIEQFDLNVTSLEDFEKRKADLLSNTNQLIFPKALLHAKKMVISAFYEALRPIEISENKRYEFIGVFLNCCQIPITEDSTFLLSPNFEENLSEISYQAIGNFIRRPPKTHL